MIARFGLQTLAIVAVGFTVGALAGCQHLSGQVGDGPAGLGFYFFDEGQTGKLVYGVADSDDVDLMLECIKGSREMEVTLVKEPDGKRLKLTSGTQQSELAGRVLPNEESGGHDLAAEAPTDSPALIGFRQTGRLEAVNGKNHVGMSAKPSEMDSIARFFAACEHA